MAGLIDSLTSAARSLQTHQYAMGVVGQNISNVNTPGYARRVVDLVPVDPAAGGGVDIQAIRSVRDMLLERRLLQEVPLSARETAMADGLAVVETALGKPGESIDARLSGFFDAFSALAQDPTSAVARNQVVLAAKSLTSAFGDMNQRLETARRDADTHIRGAVEEINEITSRIAAINNALPAAQQNGTAGTLVDQQSELLRQLSELADVHVIDRQQGGVDVTFGAGRPLVIGGSRFTVTATSTAPSGYVALSSEGTTVTSELTGGKVGGLLQLRDVDIPGYVARLDTLAFDTAAQVNARHAAGYDQNGTAGLNLFTFSSAILGSTGAAAAITVNSTIVADPARVAAAGVAQTGDNQAARNIASLRSDRVLNGATASLTDAWSSLVYRAGSDSRAAADAAGSRKEIVRQVDALRDQVAGVSLDEEAMNLLKFQRAYEANARFFTAIDRMLNTLIQTI